MKNQAGAVLPVALIMLAALTLLVSGSWILAKYELSVARGATDFARGSLASRSAVRTVRAGAGLEGEVGMAVTPLFSGRFDRVEYGSNLIRLNAEWSLVEGWGIGAPDGVMRQNYKVVWSLDPIARVGAAKAVVSFGRSVKLAGDASISGSRVRRGLSGRSCPLGQAALDSIFADGGLDRSRAAPAMDTIGAPWLGLLTELELNELLPSLSPEAWQVGPEVVGPECVDSRSNWGDPRDPDAVCADRRVTGFVEGDLTVDGIGQGLLAVAGSLRLAPGTVFGGLILVRDSLVLEQDSELLGFARVGGSVELGPGSRVEGRACPVLLALDEAPQLQSLFMSPEGAWLRSY